MESLTKREIEWDVIETMVRRAFDTAVSPQHITPLTAGWFNTAYAIQLPGELPDVVLRIAPPPSVCVLTYEQNLMRREVVVHRLVQAAATIPVPRLLAHNFDHDIIGQDYMFVAKLKGVPLDQVQAQLAPEEMDAIRRQIGQIALAINQIKGEQFGYAGTALSANNWPDAFLKMVLALLNDGEDLGVSLPVPVAEIRELYGELSGWLPQVERPSLCHYDLWLPNIFVVRGADGWQVEAVTDWERAFWGDPEADTVIANGPLGRPFWQGYGWQPDDTPATQKRYALYRTYLWLIMLIEAKIRFEDAAHLPWTRERFTEDWQWLAQ